MSSLLLNIPSRGPVAVQTCCGQHPCQQEAHPAASTSETVDPGLFTELHQLTFEITRVYTCISYLSILVCHDACGAVLVPC